MKYLLILIILTYQKLFSHYTPQCLSIPSCSQYAINAIREHGCLTGLDMAAARIQHCTLN